MKFYIIAGEASGDLHGSNLIKELKKKDPSAEFRCWGGDKMQAAGATLVKHYRELAFMGFTEVLMNLGTILRNLRFCKKDILQYRPDAIILVDYPGFNMPVAKWAKEKGFPKAPGIKVIYYISPQVWAWKENRVTSIKKYVDKMLVILPFEKAFYKKWNYEVDYVGHPLVEVVEDYKNSRVQYPVSGIMHHSPVNIIALLPGSRKQEIMKKLPYMLEVAKLFPAYQFIVAKAPSVEEGFYSRLMMGYSNVSTVENKTYDLLTRSKAALVTSGTATLETALFAVPQVICYKGSSISYIIAKKLVKIKYIGLVNLIMDKEVVKELIQDELTVEKLRYELNELLTNKAKLQQVKDDYASLKEILSKGGHASANAAGIIYDQLTFSPQ
jgi:lipid-A-disaccharide synthase